MRVRHRISGDRELVATFKRLSAAARGDKLEQAATAGILPIQNEATRLAKWKSGNLRRSIHTETLKKSANAVEVGTGTDVDYAQRIEYGFMDTDSLGRTYNQEAQPYMRPAYDTKQGEAIQETENALRDLILAAV